MRAFADTFLSALRTLGTNKLRSILTLLGIVIGVVAVVAMSATTVGLQDQFSKGLAELGSGVFQVQKWPKFGDGGNHAKYERRKNMTIGEVNLLDTHCQTCLRVAGEMWEMGQKISTSGSESREGVPVVGGTVAFFDNNGYALGSGRFFSEGEVEHGADVAVVGADVVDILYPKEDPIDKTIRVANRPFRIVGVIERRGEMMGFSLDNLVAIPMATAQMIYGAHDLNITIQARDPKQLGAAEDEVETLLRKQRGVPPEAEDDFDLFSNQSMQEHFEEMTGNIAIASVAICAIALLIGGIGVMNIMLVAVTERTSEVGLRRALGARRRRILGQFLTEAVMLTSIGGIIGILLGAGVAYLIRALADVPTSVPASAVVYSMLVAGGTGLVFGIYPAWRAARLDPVEAMRQE